MWYEKLRATAPDAISNQLELAELYLSLGQLQAAYVVVRGLEVRHGDNLRVLLVLGQVHLAKREPRAAATVFRQISRLAGFDSTELQIIAEHQIQANDPGGARRALQKSV